MGKSRFVFTPLGYFARLYQFLVREPPSLPVFDTKLVGSFFTPSGRKAPVARGFPGDFAGSYDSEDASLYRKSGTDGQSRCLRRSILPRLSISPNCVDTIWRNVFSRNRFGISPNRLPLCILPDLDTVSEGEYHAAIISSQKPSSSALFAFIHVSASMRSASCWPVTFRSPGRHAT